MRRKIAIIFLLLLMILLLSAAVVYLWVLPGLGKDVMVKLVSRQTGKEVKVGTISYDLKGNFSLHDVLIKDKPGKKAFSKTLKYQHDWMSVSIDSLKLFRLRWWNYLVSGNISIDSVQVFGPVTDIYRDKNLPEPPFEIRPLPASMLKMIPVRLKIGKVTLHKGTVHYTENNPGRGEGTVWFTELSLEVYNITNDKAALKKDRDLRVHAEALLAGTIKIRTDIDAKLTSGEDEFTLEAETGSFQASDLDPILTGMAGIQAGSGNIHSVSIFMAGNNEGVEGELNAQYEELRLNIPGRENDEPKRRKKSFIKSAIANLFIKNRNLQGKRSFRKGGIFFERRKDKSFMNLLWGGTRSGIVDLLVKVKQKE